jgi:hypothetical protein
MVIALFQNTVVAEGAVIVRLPPRDLYPSVGGVLATAPFLGEMHRTARALR